MAASRAANDSPSANRRGSDTCARGGKTIGLMSSGLAALPQTASAKPTILPRPCSNILASRARFFRIVELAFERIDVDRQLRSCQQVMPDVLVAGNAIGRVDAEQRRKYDDEALGVLLGACRNRGRLRRSSAGCSRWARRPCASSSQRPARQRFARIPFALAEMEKCARRETIAQSPQ